MFVQRAIVKTSSAQLILKKNRADADFSPILLQKLVYLRV